MTVLPFVCLAIGIIMGLFIKSKGFLLLADKISTLALVCLMMTIGIGIGLNESIMINLARIGFNCVVISISAILFSVLATVICERTVLPLEKMNDELKKKNLSISGVEGEHRPDEPEQGQDEKKSPLVWMMPLSIVMGLILGIFLRNMLPPTAISKFFTIFLIILYVCVGISQGSNRSVFSYIRLLGVRVLWLPFAILAGSLSGGLISGIILGLPLHTSMISASGMSFYSLTGAYMTQTYGIETGTYGFIVNVMREFFTVLAMPFLVKISKGSPIAGGAAGNMDTMLAPVTKFVGVQLGLVTLITGTVLTFLVPFLLPLLSSVLRG